MAADNPKTFPGYTFGVFPFLSKPTLESIFAPIAKELSESLQRPVQLKSASSFEEFTGNLKRMDYEIAHINPFEYVLAGKPAGYIPLAVRTEMLKAVFVVKEESHIKQAHDMKGKIIGLPPKVAAVSYLARITLAELEMRPDKDVDLRYFSTHQNCLQQLLIGNIDVCASGSSILRLFENESKTKLRKIQESPEVPHTVFVVHRRVPVAEHQKIRQTLVNSELKGVNPDLLIFFTKSKDGYFKAAQDKDFDAIRNYLILAGEK